ncbi:MAG: benzoate-CoA ligase family protein [Acidobacteriota bacterium]
MTWTPPERLNLAQWVLGEHLRAGRGDRVALRLADRHITYLGVARRANRVARHLRSLGIGEEDRVVVALEDGVDFVTAFFSTLQIGAVVVMVNPELADDSLDALLDYVRPRVVFIESGRESVVRRDRLRHGGEVIVPATQKSAGQPFADDAESDAGDRLAPLVDSHRDDPAIWLFSGGTTGRPKAVVQSHGAFANTTELYAVRTLGYSEDDITLSVPKLYFGYATGSNLLFPLQVGGSAVLFAEKPTPDVLFEHIDTFRPTILINVPTLINRMVSHPDAATRDLSCLRFTTSAGEALPVPLHERWNDTFGGELLDGLGTAEMWHVFVTNRPGDVIPGTLGKVVDGFEIRIRDDKGRDLADGEVGRMWVRGRSRALGYWRNLEKTCECFRGEWFVGGDLASRNPATGAITYCGRGDDVLKVGGRWLVPQEVEACLLRNAAVREAAVIGAEDAQGLTKPYAFVIPTDPDHARTDLRETDLGETLKAWVLDELDAYKHPRRVFIVADLPRTHLGKVDRRALRDRLGSLDG